MISSSLTNSHPDFSATARRLGITSALVVLLLQLMYAVALVVGLTSLPSPDHPIGDPVFTVLEVLILLMLPAMVALMAAVHAWTPPTVKVLGLTALAFMVLVAGVSGSLHFLILTLGRQPDFGKSAELTSMLAFEWPSVAYALDILAWDVFFALSMLFAAPAFSGSKLALWIRVLMIASGTLALTGLLGVIAGDMQLRNVGIVGYVGAFVFVCALMAMLFYRTNPLPEEPIERNN